VTTTLRIAVQDQAPEGLLYSPAALRFVQGEEIVDPSVPGTTGGGDVTKFSITPELPLGLVFDTETGAVTGKSADVFAPREFAVVASNGGGNTATTITIEVRVGFVGKPNCLYGHPGFASYSQHSAYFSEYPLSLLNCRA
jgi:hypothetical protein